MKLYFHKWLDADTNQLSKLGDSRIATSIEEAIDDYHQENCVYQYVDTVVLDTQTKTFIEIDIRVEIETKKRREMTIGELADYLCLPPAQAQRRLDKMDAECHQC